MRLVQIDAPEPGVECFGTAASRTLAELVPAGTRVELEEDSGLDPRDRFGRLLRYVYADKRNLNVLLVERGSAAPYFFRNAHGRYARELLAAAGRAVEGRRGLWGKCPGAHLNPRRSLDSGPP